MQISKKAKGFPISLPMTHWFMLHQHYAWLQSLGLGTPEMEAALAVMPNVEIDQEAFDFAKGSGYSPLTAYNYPKPPFYKNKTVRIRAEHVHGTIELFRVVAAFFVGGQLGGTLLTRVRKLEDISELDLLADASR